MTTLLTAGEALDVPERLVVAPSTGIFRPRAPATVTTEGELVTVGQVLGVLEAPACRTPVESPFDGFLMGMLALPGERVRAGQPVAWLRAL